MIRAAPAFSGNYISMGAKGIRFRVKRSHDCSVQLAFHNADTGQTWRYRIPDLTIDAWQTVDVSLDYHTLKDIDGANNWAAFKAAIKNRKRPKIPKRARQTCRPSR